MSVEILESFLNEGILILIPVMWIIGAMLKTSRLNSAYIPFILLALSIGYVGILTKDVIEALTQGVIVTGITVLTHQLVAQTRELI